MTTPPLDHKHTSRRPIEQQVDEAWKVRSGDTVRITTQGKLLTAKILRPPTRVPPIGARGAYTSFTKGARFRMLKVLASIDWKKVGNPLFITLTYPNRGTELTRKDLNKHRYLFFRSLEKALGEKQTGIWRIEWKKRQTGEHTGKVYPHFHVILMSTKFIGHMVINQCWKKAIGEETYVRTDTQGMQSEAQAVYYVSKYCAKAEDTSLVYDANLNIPSGKDWGVHRRDLLPRATKEVFNVSVKGTLWAELLAMANEPEVVARNGGESFTLLGDMVEEAMRIVRAKFPLDKDASSR